MSSSLQIGDGAWLLALRTPTLPPATTTNTLILGADRLVVIEPATPYPDEQRRLDAELSRLQAEGRQVVALLLTHHHADHIGYAADLRRRLGAPLLAHAETAARVPFTVDRRIDEEWQLDLGDGHRLTAIFTPGHAPGHLVYLDVKTEIGHAGDLVAGTGTIVIDPDDAGDMAIYIASLGRLAARLRGRGARLVPAHGPVIEDPVALLEHYVAHRLRREERIVAALTSAADLDAVLAQAYDDTPRELWPIARQSLRAHLAKLAAEGRLDPSPPAARSAPWRDPAD